MIQFDAIPESSKQAHHNKPNQVASSSHTLKKTSQAKRAKQKKATQKASQSWLHAWSGKGARCSTGCCAELPQGCKADQQRGITSKSRRELHTRAQHKLTRQAS